MKKLILFTMLMITIPAISQTTEKIHDGFNQQNEFYETIKTSTTGLTLPEVAALVQELVELTQQPYSYLKTNESADGIDIIYQLDSVSLPIPDKDTFENLSFRFTKEFTLIKIQGNESMVIPIWANFFFGGKIDKSMIKGNYKFRTLHSEYVDLYYDLVEKKKYYVIENRNKK